MKYYRLIDPLLGYMLAVESEPGVLSILSSAEPELQSLDKLFEIALTARMEPDEISRRIIQSEDIEKFELDELVNESREDASFFGLASPIEAPEVWAAGVTYKSSEMERRRESDTPDVYSKVYGAERPELFFKSTPHRTSGPFEPIGIREDSPWNVPEPELAFVLHRGEIVGYTIGNDVSSRTIEGENPLYLPQAKLYDSSCAIGPCVATPDVVGDPHDLDVSCVITRGGVEVFSGTTSTAEMARTCQELADWLQRHNSVPDMTTVLTGTSLVPPPDFTLQEEDVVSITIENIGTLENEVMVV